MTVLSVVVLILALLTAFAMGLVTGEDLAKDRHDFWCAILADEEEEDDGGAEEQDPVAD